MATPLDRVRVVQGDITRLAVDAIVNAANQRLLGGGGVDGAIHRAAGPELLAACRALPEISPGVRCPTGESRITPGFRLPARYVIHTVGPVWAGGDRGEPEKLAACYRSALALAREHGLRRIAFPAISCGVYGYPPAQAARVAVATLAAELMKAEAIDEVLLVAFDEPMAQTLQAALDEARAEGDD
ncbi:MAG: O-acetyl-ADP-ribose deacetylase [Gammaproteobacteria bacterium]|nr:MAG: O-acetyl-ADP-ribose deacetylase [Gammaproteobacteria bacterium]